MAHTQSKGAIQVIPFLIGLGIMAAIETGIGEMLCQLPTTINSLQT
jgi:hypothetical protein